MQPFIYNLIAQFYRSGDIIIASLIESYKYFLTLGYK